MVYEDAAAYGRARMDLDAGQPACDMRGKAPQPFEIVGPEPVRPALHDDGVQARVAGNNFPFTARSRVAGNDVGDVFSDTAEHKVNMDMRKMLG
ncbi:hypothetical protein D3C73_1526000 [compost metagenome]